MRLGPTVLCVKLGRNLLRRRVTGGDVVVRFRENRKRKRVMNCCLTNAANCFLISIDVLCVSRGRFGRRESWKSLKTLPTASRPLHNSEQTSLKRSTLSSLSIRPRTSPRRTSLLVSVCYWQRSSSQLHYILYLTTIGAEASFLSRYQP